MARRATANTFSSSGTSRSAVMERSTRCSSDSRVCSSTIDANLIALPSVVESNWKSIAHTTFGASATTPGTEDIPDRFRGLWTRRCRPSSHHSRCTFFTLTPPPKKAPAPPPVAAPPRPPDVEDFTICPSGLSGVASEDTSCAFADNVRRSWYSGPGNLITAYSPITDQEYIMRCTAASTTAWPAAQRCVGVNPSGATLVVYIA